MGEIIHVEHAQVLPASAPLPLDQSPAHVYLARLSSGSRPAILNRLQTICTIVRPGSDPLTVRWADLRYAHTQAIRSQLADSGLAPSTANATLAALRGVLREAWRLGQIDRESMERACDLKPIKGSRAQKGRQVSNDEFSKLFAACDADPSPAGKRDAAMLAVLYGAGLRRAECVALDVRDFDPDEGSILVRKGKGSKTRLCYLSDGAVNRLESWLELSQADEAMFTRILRGGHMTSERLTTGAVRSIILARCDDAGVADFAPHDARRSFASALLDSGTDLNTVSRMMGHASVQVTSRYDLRGERTKRAAAQNIRI